MSKNYIKGVDLGMSFEKLNRIWQNPMLIHRIQDKLMEVNPNTILGYAIRTQAKSNIKGCIKMVLSQYKDNADMILDIVGKETMDLITEFQGGTL